MVLKYAVQLAGRDFEPLGDWNDNPRAAVLALQTSDDYDLLVYDPTGERCEIYVQRTLASLADQLEHTAYARLLDRMARTYQAAGFKITPQLQSRWYLVSYLAVLEHQSLLNTAAALLSISVQFLKATDVSESQLRGLADQARCWLMAANVSDLQLIATAQPLTTLLTYLLDQAGALDACTTAGRSKAWQLANDAVTLSCPSIQPTELQTASAWTLIRAAAFE